MRKLPLASVRWKAVSTSAWALADQGVVSASNFFVMILLARQMGPNTFGAFVLSYTALLFLNSVHASMFSQPHNVLGALKSEPSYRTFTTTLGWAQFAFSLLVMTVCLISLSFIPDSQEEYRKLLTVIAIILPAVQSQDYFRRVLYTQLRYKSAFLNDVLAYGGQVLLTAVLWRLSLLTGQSSIWIIGLSSLVACFVGFIQLRHSFVSKMQVQQIREDMTEAWVFGRWLLAGTGLYWLSSQLFPLLTSGFIGSAALGGLRATQNLVAPTHIILKSVESVLPSRAARSLHSGGMESLRTTVIRIGVPAIGLMAVYCTVVSILARPLVRFTLGDEYVEYWWLVMVVAVTYVLTLLTALATITLQAGKATRSTFLANAAGAVFVLSIGIWLVYSFRLPGTAIGMIGSVLVVGTIAWIEVFRMVERDS